MSQKNEVSDRDKSSNGFVFQKINYQLFLLSIAIVMLGFFLMMGKEDIYSFTKITLAPIVVTLGFAVGFIAILYKPKPKR